MKKTSSIIKLIVVGVALAICMILATCSFRIPGTDYNYNSFASVIDLGLDLKGGVYALFEASSEDTTDFADKLEATKSRLTEMLTSRGYTEAVVVTEGENRIRVSIPSKDDAEGLFTIIGKPAGIEFVIDGSGGNGDVVLTGDDVVSATGAYGNTGTTSGTCAYVSLELTDAGLAKFAEATGSNIGKTMSIYLVYDGDRETNPITTATINSQITGNPIITMGGSATEADAKNLATQINSGTFQLTLSVVDTGNESATLGEQALKMSIIGGLIGLLIIFIFLIARYRLIGLSSVLTLLIYGVLDVFILATFPFVQLSLPGIAGVLLGIGRLSTATSLWQSVFAKNTNRVNRFRQVSMPASRNREPLLSTVTSPLLSRRSFLFSSVPVPFTASVLRWLSVSYFPYCARCSYSASLQNSL